MAYKLAIIQYDGRVAEWPNASVLKTEVGQPPTVGSNPTSSVLFPLKKT
jgi:hypothetical protein